MWSSEATNSDPSILKFDKVIIHPSIHPAPHPIHLTCAEIVEKWENLGTPVCTDGWMPKYVPTI
jgi:hypothetical protein